MDVSFRPGEVINGWRISSKVGLDWYIAKTNDTILCFESQAGSGNNYFRTLWYTDLRTGRQYKAERYLLKYTLVVRELSGVLYKRYQKENTLWSRVIN